MPARRHLGGGAALMAVLVLCLSEADGLGRRLTTAHNSRKHVLADDDLRRSHRYASRDWPIVLYIRRNFPKGTAVQIPWEDRWGGRIMMGFWFSLLPDYPIRDNSELTIRHVSRVPAGTAPLARGQEFMLLRSGQGGP